MCHLDCTVDLNKNYTMTTGSCQSKGVHSPKAVTFAEEKGLDVEMLFEVVFWSASAAFTHACEQTHPDAKGLDPGFHSLWM